MFFCAQYIAWRNYSMWIWYRNLSDTKWNLPMSIMVHYEVLSCIILCFPWWCKQSLSNTASRYLGLDTHHQRALCVGVFLRCWSQSFMFPLQKLIFSETVIFDVLHAFFYHVNKLVCMASLEVGSTFFAFYLFILSNLWHSLFLLPSSLFIFGVLLITCI